MRSSYAAAYDGARGAMIVDVVASRQRRYTSRVTGIVSDWKVQNAEHTIAWLADHRLEHQRYGLSDGEVDTIHEVANRLRAFAAQEGLTTAEQEDRLCRVWADGCGASGTAPKLDPVIGSVKGIGLALFAYARMRSGADVSIKPDVRVKKGLRSLGFSVPDETITRCCCCRHSRCRRYRSVTTRSRPAAVVVGQRFRSFCPPA